MEPKKKIALVSGGNRGIGAAVAARLAESGVLVLIGSRDLAAGQAVAAPLVAEGGEAVAVQLDVTDDASVAALAGRIAETWGRLDILVNNAGIGLDHDTRLTPVARIARTLEVNVTGTLRLTEAMVPLLARGVSPRIVNISSELGSFALRQDPDWEHADKIMPTYAASKAAVNALTVGYAQSLAGQGIKVNAICPGYTATAATNFGPDRTPGEAASAIAALALADADGPTGGFLNEAGALPW
ncbi:short-chain dehydrogenase [Rhodovulum sp. BSW8]|uniref:SDR family NAD(P)-dependent oxidoreductase n=1 Tax=Rhodovulum sp. BSW8 TaxID=2259645 RepID=UPI000DE4F2DA|nr:SDR family NAD(P)-dependent oxidoreductase [Rhodovulum sp. BSW8]RBO53084.1 short-chain dehydrogenase [Rhodovulum sp. BSW8]